jgi:transcriptional regulator with XRE-family HTH domain
MLAKEGVTAAEMSRRLGKSRLYMTTLFANERVPTIGTMTSVCKELNYDLLVRSRDDGYEITIDPPE